MTSAEVKQIRLSLGLSRVEFASALGASVRSVEAWETRLRPGSFVSGCIYALQSRTGAKTPAGAQGAPKAAGTAA